MNDIDVRRFVDINIKQHVESAISGTRDVVVLYTHEGVKGKISGTVSSSITNELIFASFNAAEKIYDTENFPDTNAYLSMYFNNAGARIVVIEGYGANELTTEMIQSLDNNYILIALCDSNENAVSATTKLKSIATSFEKDNSIYGVNEKIIFARTTVKTDNSVIANFALKYSNVYAAEMTMAAYLSGINVYGVNTVDDYMFTAENIAEETLTDDEYKTMQEQNINVDTYFAGNVRNLGGNLKNGADMVNNFVRIVLHQTLTQRLLTLLTTKLKNNDGIGKIYATICNELANYRNCGYLSTDKIWTSPTMKVTVNESSYTIIEQDTPLINGYKVTVLPLSALTKNDIALHKAPPIYVIIADQYGIRAITVNGEII